MLLRLSHSNAPTHTDRRILPKKIGFIIETKPEGRLLRSL